MQTDHAALFAVEVSLWREVTRFDRALMDRTFAAGFFDIGRSGWLWSRSDCLAAAAHSINIELPLPEFAVHAVTDDTALVSYISALSLMVCR
jgi:hypothetical protein